MGDVRCHRGDDHSGHHHVGASDTIHFEGRPDGRGEGVEDDRRRFKGLGEVRRGAEELRQREGSGRVQPRSGAGRVSGSSGGLRFRQDDGAAHPLRPGDAERRTGAYRRSRRHRGPAEISRHFDGVPVLRAVSAQDCRREYRLSAEGEETAEGRDGCRHPRCRAAGAAGSASRPLSARAVRRPATACGPGARHHPPAVCVPDG